MANSDATAREDLHQFLAGPQDLAIDVPNEEAPGADQIPGATVSLEIDEHYEEPEEPPSNWRRDYANSVGMRLQEKL